VTIFEKLSRLLNGILLPIFCNFFVFLICSAVYENRYLNIDIFYCRTQHIAKDSCEETQRIVLFTDAVNC